VDHLDNPRKEAEEHYYNPTYTGLLDLGLQPHYLSDDVMDDLLERISGHRNVIDTAKIQPRVRWND